jgi:peptidoglycan/LPS O-acetylase OafA/YrhL
MWATMRLIIVGIIWLAVSSPLLPRPYSAGVAAALIVAGMSLSSKPRPRYSPFVRSVVFLGDISYSLYCTHLLTFGLVAWTVTNLAISPLGHAWAYMAAMLTAGLVVGAATYLAFEKPTTNSVQKLIERPRSPMKSAIGNRDVRAHTPNEVARAASYVEKESSKDAIGLLSEVEWACCCDTRWRSKSPTT